MSMLDIDIIFVNSGALPGAVLELPTSEKATVRSVAFDMLFLAIHCRWDSIH